VRTGPERNLAVTGEPPSTRPRIRRLVGVYNADGTLRGELAYWVGARLGRAHCALCDITHGAVRERTDWKSCRAGLPVPFDTYHLDDQPDRVRAAIAGRAPAVLADTDQGLVVLMGPADLERCESSPDKLSAALADAAELHHLRWP
jgi:hypothetical protein